MNPTIPGLHHITAIAGDAQANVDFYCGVLGLRLVKRTINFDDPGTYHLYYGDAAGSPGTIMTFFPWAGAHRGWQGKGQATVTSFAIPASTIELWQRRLNEKGIAFDGPTLRFGEPVLRFTDPDGMALELIGSEPESSVSDIVGFHSVTLEVATFDKTAALLTDVMGYTLIGEEHSRTRFAVNSIERTGKDVGKYIDILRRPDAPNGLPGVGTIHHIAFRTPDDAQQELWLEKLGGLGYGVSPVMDRSYFHSIYFREPGNVLFEIATDPPGFTIDEPLTSLGERLMLPPWLEDSRDRIEGRLPKLRLPGA